MMKIIVPQNDNDNIVPCIKRKVPSPGSVDFYQISNSVTCKDTDQVAVNKECKNLEGPDKKTIIT